MKEKAWKVFRWVLIRSVALAVLGVLSLVACYYYFVVCTPAEYIKKENIIRTLERSTIIYYRDGETRFNFLSGSYDRLYVPYSDIPQEWVEAIVSSEDKNFFVHSGVDPLSIIRAVFLLVKKGRVVSGGSTITQQTAKNLFTPDGDFSNRTVVHKFFEVWDAFRLEREYSKEEILEFYANQFQVHGEGRGIGVAARYYFDKNVTELTILESAYIAGMLQSPARYNPFASTNPEKKQKAYERAHTRTHYVLGRMLDNGYISQGVYDQLIKEKIPFKRGDFRYSRTSVVDEIVDRLHEEPYVSVLAGYGITSPATAGLEIVTTLDADIQRHAQYGLVHHLTDVGSVLEGVQKESLFHSETLLKTDKRGDYELGQLFYGKIVEKKGVELVVGDANVTCVVDKTALKRISTILKKAKDTKFGSTPEALLHELHVNDVLWLSVRDIQEKKDGKQYFCDIEIPVNLQGAVLALHHGEILAMVGGAKNIHFNRAISAQRQFGSTWKPLIYTAALQLGWSPLDLLDNRINPFPFERVWYYPKAGHKGAPDFPSVSWTGVNSENRASVWLLYHLTDRLTVSDYKVLIEMLGLSKQSGESDAEYLKRIRDDLGVISTKKQLEEVAFYAAKRQLLHKYENLVDIQQNLPYHAMDLVRVRSMLYTGNSKEYDKQKDATTKHVLQQNYVDIVERSGVCTENWTTAKATMIAYRQTLPSTPDAEKDATTENTANLPLIEKEIEAIIEEPSFADMELWWDSQNKRVGCGLRHPASTLIETLRMEHVADIVDLENLDIWIDGEFSLAMIRELQTQQVSQQVLLETRDPYSIEFLQHHPDFQEIVNIRYVNYLLNGLGVPTKLPLTLTVPLGAVEISLLEATMMYNGLLTGQRYSLSEDMEDASQRGNVLIKQIKSSDGTLLYDAQLHVQQVSNDVSGILLSDILHNIVQHGTAQRAKSFAVNGVSIPLLGKTGTTNAYKNAAFVGMVPKAEAGSWNIKNGVTIASYVGFDTPTPMSFGKLQLSGASGALPVWLETAKGVAYSNFIGFLDPKMEYVPKDTDGFYAIPVNDSNGVTDPEGKAFVWIYDAEKPWEEEPRYDRAFSPMNIKEMPNWNSLRKEVEEEIDNPEEEIDAKISPTEKSELQEDTATGPVRITPHTTKEENSEDIVPEPSLEPAPE